MGRAAPGALRLECVDGREQAAAARMRRWMWLPGREVLAFHGRLERVVVAVGAPALLRRYPLQQASVARGVEHSARPRDREDVYDHAFERLQLPLAVPGADAFDHERRAVAVVRVVD